MTKALREAKLHTSWINVNAPYERGIAQFIDLLLHRQRRIVRAELRRFVRGILMPGICNSLAQVVLKITAPACPTLSGDRAVGPVAGRSRQSRRSTSPPARAAGRARQRVTPSAGCAPTCSRPATVASSC
jgi:hypothetical protein